MPRLSQFKAQVRFLTRDEGGRSGAIASGYRPNFYFGRVGDDGERMYNDAVIYLEGTESVEPGDSCEVRIAPHHPELIDDLIRPGLEFDVTEGARVVGKGKVLKRMA